MEMHLEIIFDYACPYCYQAHLYLKEIHKEYPELQMVFTPCEAHPRPERWGNHSDLALKGMHYCLDHGIDIWAYHNRIYRAFHVERIDVENLDTLAAYLEDILDADDFKAALSRGAYEPERLAANQYAWETLSLNAVPSFCMGTRTLKAVEDIGVSKQMLLEYLGLI